MGNCPQACKIYCFEDTNIVKGYQVPIYDDIINKYSTQPNYSTLIFLQIRIKKYLRYKKLLSSSNYIKFKTII